MYATTRQMIDAVIEEANGGQMQSNTGGVTVGQVQMLLNQMRCKAAFERHFFDRRNDDITIDDAFVRVWDDVSVQFNERRKLWYCDLPTPFLDLPRYMGIVHVGPLEDPFTQYIVRSSGHLAITAGSPAEAMHGLPYCFPEGDGKLFLMNVNTGEKLVDKLLVKLVPGMYWDELDAPTGIPASMQADIVMKLVQWFSGIRQIPVDSSNDGNKNTL